MDSIEIAGVVTITPGKNFNHLEKDVFPCIGNRPIDEISAAELLVVLKRIDVRSSATARKAYSSCKQVFIHAIPSGKIVVSHAEVTW